MYIHLDVTFTDLIFYLAFSVNIYLSLSSGNFLMCEHQGVTFTREIGVLRPDSAVYEVLH